MLVSSFESSPAQARQVRRTVEFAGKKRLRIRKSRKQRYRRWPSIFVCLCAQSETNIGTSRGTGALRESWGQAPQ